MNGHHQTDPACRFRAKTGSHCRLTDYTAVPQLFTPLVFSPYAIGPAPMYYGSGYIGKGDFWKFGMIFGVIFFAGC
jgi:hypothetical protein